MNPKARRSQTLDNMTNLLEEVFRSDANPYFSVSIVLSSGLNLHENRLQKLWPMLVT